MTTTESSTAVPLIAEPEALSLYALPCEVCGQPSVGWLTSESVEDGMDTLTCESVCEQHVPKGVQEA